MLGENVLLQQFCKVPVFLPGDQQSSCYIVINLMDVMVKFVAGHRKVNIIEINKSRPALSKATSISFSEQTSSQVKFERAIYYR